MNTKNFVFWLNGFFELSDAKELNEQQVQIIKDHLALVLNKQTPDRIIDKTIEPKEKQILNDNSDVFFHKGNSSDFLLCETTNSLFKNQFIC